MADVVSLLSRRNVLLTMAGGAASLGAYASQGGTGFTPVSLGAFFSQDKTKLKTIKLATAEVDAWKARVGTFFTLETGHVLKLGSVAEFADPDGPPPAGLRRKAFLARFDIDSGLSGAKGPLEVERIYQVSHPSGGTFAIFLSEGDAAKPEQKLAVFG